jgi:hypothetical protein
LATLLLLAHIITDAMYGITQHGPFYLLMAHRDVFIVLDQLASQPVMMILQAYEPMVALNFAIRALAGLEKAKSDYKIRLLLYVIGVQPVPIHLAQLVNAPHRHHLTHSAGCSPGWCGLPATSATPRWAAPALP